MSRRPQKLEKAWAQEDAEHSIFGCFLFLFSFACACLNMCMYLSMNVETYVKCLPLLAALDKQTRPFTWTQSSQIHLGELLSLFWGTPSLPPDHWDYVWDSFLSADSGDACIADILHTQPCHQLYLFTFLSLKKNLCCKHKWLFEWLMITPQENFFITPCLSAAWTSSLKMREI